MPYEIGLSFYDVLLALIHDECQQSKLFALLAHEIKLGVANAVVQ
jgi:hypothetical protein